MNFRVRKLLGNIFHFFPDFPCRALSSCAGYAFFISNWLLLLCGVAVEYDIRLVQTSSEISVSGFFSISDGLMAVTRSSFIASLTYRGQ